MKTKIILIVVLALLVLPILIKADSNLIFSHGSTIDLKIPCVFEELAYCDSYASCNLTVNYPNGTNLINNQPMTYNDAYFNYTLNENQTEVIGEYPSTMVCTDQGAAGFSSFSFQITSIGAKNEFLINLALFIFIIIAIVLFMVGLNKEDAWITMLSSFMFIFAGFWIYYNHIYYFPEFINLVLSLVLWGFGAYILLKTAYELADTG